MNRRNCGPVLLGALGAAIAVSAAIAPDVAWGQHPQRPRSTAHAAQSHARAVPKVEKPRDLVRRFLAMASRESGPGSAHNRYTYEALVEYPTLHNGDQHVGQRHQILVDKTKFCIKMENMTLRSPPHGTSTRRVRNPDIDAAMDALQGRPYYDTWSLYDGGHPDVAWQFWPSGRSQGFPRPQDRSRSAQFRWRESACQPETNSYLLGLAAHRDGLDAVIDRYGLCADLAPGGVPNVFSNQGDQLGLLTTKEVLFARDTAKARLVSAGVVAGFHCKIYASSSSHSRGTRQETRYWVDDRTGFVLKRESRMTRGEFYDMGGGTSRLPADVQRSLNARMTFGLLHYGDFEVKSLKFYKSLPPSLFEIPPGTKVIFTALMTDIGVKAPKGVIRIPYMTNHNLPSYEVDPGDAHRLLSSP